MNKEYYSSYDHVFVVGDGDHLRAEFHNFHNIGEHYGVPLSHVYEHSPTGFGNTDAEAIEDLAHNLRVMLQQAITSYSSSR